MNSTLFNPPMAESASVLVFVDDDDVVCCCRDDVDDALPMVVVGVDVSFLFSPKPAGAILVKGVLTNVCNKRSCAWIKD